jgi:hypothetical protein
VCVGTRLFHLKNVRSDGATDAPLSVFLERDVALVARPEASQTGGDVWFRIAGLAPADIVESLGSGTVPIDQPTSS